MTNRYQFKFHQRHCCFRRITFLITVQDLVFYFTSVGTDLVVSILIAVTWFILAALCFREQCLHPK